MVHVVSPLTAIMQDQVSSAPQLARHCRTAKFYCYMVMGKFKGTDSVLKTMSYCATHITQSHSRSMERELRVYHPICPTGGRPFEVTTGMLWAKLQVRMKTKLIKAAVFVTGSGFLQCGTIMIFTTHSMNSQACQTTKFFELHVVP